MEVGLISSKQQTETRVRKSFTWKSFKKVLNNLVWSFKNEWIIMGSSPKECEIMETLPPFASKWGFLVVNISYSLREISHYLTNNKIMIFCWYLLSSCCKAAQISIRNRGLEATRLDGDRKITFQHQIQIGTNHLEFIKQRSYSGYYLQASMR